MELPSLITSGTVMLSTKVGFEASNAAHDINPMALEIETATSKLCDGEAVEVVTTRDLIKGAGAIVGYAVGITDGWALGCTDGLLDGCDEGCNVGRDVGCNEGRAEGCEVG